MKLKDFRFKLTNIETKESAILSFDDIFGYEGEIGEVDGVLICHGRKHIPKSLQDGIINYNSGYGYDGLNEIWDIEYVAPMDGANANEQSDWRAIQMHLEDSDCIQNHDFYKR